MKTYKISGRLARALAVMVLTFALAAAGQGPASTSDAPPDKSERVARRSKKSDKDKDKKVASKPKDVITRARKAYNDMQFKDAAENYQKYIELEPNGPDRDEAGFFYGQCLYLLHRFNEADVALAMEQKRNKSYPDQVLYFRGEIAAAIRDYSQGVVYFEKVIGEYPQSPVVDKARARRADLLYLMANQYYDQGAYSLALQNYLQIKNARTDLVPLIEYHVGMCYLNIKELENAARVLIDLAKSSGPGADDASRLAQYRLGRLFEDAGKYEQAESVFKDLDQRSQGHYLQPLAREGLARALARQGKMDEAGQVWKSQGGANKLVQRSEQFSQALMNYEHGEYDEAARGWSQLLAVANDPELQWKSKVWLARTYFAGERYPQAIKTWKELFDNLDEPQDFMRVEYAQALLTQNARAAAKVMSVLHDADTDDEMGVKALTQLEAGEPSADAVVDAYLSRYPDGHWVGQLCLRRAIERINKGNSSGAESDLRTAAARHPDPEKRLEATYELVRIYRQQGRPDSALEAVTNAAPSARQALSPIGRLSRESAEIAYARGDYARGADLYRDICTGEDNTLTCGPDGLFRLFFGLYRLKKYDVAETVLQKLEQTGGPEGAFKAGFWRGMMLLQKGDNSGAFNALRGLVPPDHIDLGLQAWLIAQTQSGGGAAGEAARTLARIDDIAPEFAYYGRGELMARALEGGDITAYLADLPDPAQNDQETLSQSALISILRTKAMAQADESELDAINRLLQVETTNEDIAAEGNLLVARAGLYGKDRDAAIAKLEEILYRNPGSRVEAEVRLYRGEDAFNRKDYEAALAWIGQLMPEEVPEELRFRLLYLQAESYKQLGNTPASRGPFLLIIQDYYDEDVPAEDWNQVGIGLYLAQEYASAVQALDLAIAKTNSRALQAEIYYWKGMAEYGSGNLDSALLYFLKVAEEYRDQSMWAVTAEYWAAGVYADKGDDDKALNLYKKVLTASRGDKARVGKVNEKIAALQKRKIKGGSDDSKGNFWDQLKRDREDQPDGTDNKGKSNVLENLLKPKH